MATSEPRPPVRSRTLLAVASDLRRNLPCRRGAEVSQPSPKLPADPPPRWRHPSRVLRSDRELFWPSLPISEEIYRAAAAQKFHSRLPSFRLTHRLDGDIRAASSGQIANSSGRRFRSPKKFTVPPRRRSFTAVSQASG